MTFKNIGVFISARMGSSRLPGKNLMPLNSEPLVSFCAKRLLHQNLDIPIYLVTTENKEDAVLKYWADSLGIKTFRGSENDLIKRHLDAAAHFGVDYIVRATSDCPFISSELLQKCLEQIKSANAFDTLATTKGSFPVGLDLEFFPTKLLQKINSSANMNDFHREHLTSYFYEKFSSEVFRIKAPEEISTMNNFLFTLDTLEDYVRLNDLASKSNDIYVNYKNLSQFISG